MNMPVIPLRFAAVKLCDPCFEEITGELAQCQDSCGISLDHAGLCDPYTETAEPCTRCGESGPRLTLVEPRDAGQAAACQPVTMTVTWWMPGHYTAAVNAAALARRLRDLPREHEDAAAAAARIVSGELAAGHASDEETTDGPDTPGLDDLIHAIAAEAGALGIEGDSPGVPDDFDDPDDYRLWLDPAPVLDCRFYAQPHRDDGTWTLAGVNKGGHRLFACSAASHILIEPHPEAGHSCIPACASYAPAGVPA